MASPRARTRSGRPPVEEDEGAEERAGVGRAGRAAGALRRERAFVGAATGSALQCIMGGPFDGTGPGSCRPAAG